MGIVGFYRGKEKNRQLGSTERQMLYGKKKDGKTREG